MVVFNIIKNKIRVLLEELNMITIKADQGTVIYSHNAIANIVGINVMEIPGVQGMAAKNAADGIWKMLQKDNYAKGIEIEAENDQLAISISIVVSYGTKFSEIAKNIIKEVKYNIENLTDLKVKNITVIIQEVIA